eukprot:CAMPEP_0197275538 /NCGR_PEP_ID=MMETSP1432-20130617/14042_1 /TAXON_ID=44447 /ORGANISM="Pseudo-nitzschia delicatissima, Strain UNC1205" /LENGTH=187 /DNA_ID=CAMNT_0042741453 /DNA_START=20 /DNA_END=584 /DNA_ORIENTATION=+
MCFTMSTPPPAKPIYGVPNSGWTSPEWNWGYAVGTGHECAAICRQKYASNRERSQLITDLLEGDPTKTDTEEVKLVMALEWQRNWRCGYRDVLEMMADARRYEEEGDPSPKYLLLMDMMERFPRLNPTKEDMAAMQALKDLDNVDCALRICSGLVLKAMDLGIDENGNKEIAGVSTGTQQIPMLGYM